MSVIEEFRNKMGESFGVATKPQHWLGRLLLLVVICSFYFWFRPTVIWGSFTGFGIPFVLIGFIYLLQRVGVELFPPEAVEYQNEPNPTLEASIFVRPGTGLAPAILWIILGLLMSRFVGSR